MDKFNLFDAVTLTKAVVLSNGTEAPAGSVAAIVEALDEGQSYLVEVFDQCIALDESGRALSSHPSAQQDYQTSLGVALVKGDEIELLYPAQETMGARGRLLVLMDQLPEEILHEVLDFAEFLQKKQHGIAA